MKPFAAIMILVFCLLAASCKKEGFITSPDASLHLSADTLHFDTLFTSTGSITQSFKIINSNNQKLRLGHVTLKGGNLSSYTINVDGFTGPEVKDLELEANDSIYVFVTVNINPNANALPFVIRDSIAVGYNGNEQVVQLEAWGQNARFLRNTIIQNNTTWNNSLPYVILGALQIDTNATLTIEKGTRIYLHADAPFIVDGTLKVNGEKYDSTRVYFQGDRLDEPYHHFPGSWPGIYFRGKSSNSVLQYAVIRNAYQGVVAEQASVNANPKLLLNECIIDNIYDAGIYGIQTAITANNCLISNCAKNIQLIYGGNYNFTHCTVAAVASNYIVHKDPVLLLNNFAKQGNNIITANVSASFRNCIFWADGGAVDDEVVIGKQGSNSFNVAFSNCLWKVKTNPQNITASNIINNQPPQFDSIDAVKKIYNFRLKEMSPAINKGMNTGLPTDLDGRPRANGVPDMGCYERQ